MIDFKTALWLTLGALHLAVIVRAILLEGRDAYARAAWLLLLIALPGIGTMLYLLFGEPWISTAFKQRARAAYTTLLPYAPLAPPPMLSPAMEGAFRTCEATSRWPVATGNTAQVASGADAAITAIVADIDAATRTVHLSFYIWLGDSNGTKVVDAVCRAARRGVACRIVADAIGSRALTRSRQWTAMRDAGAHVYASLPVPLGLGVLASFTTQIGDWLTRTAETVFVMPAELNYTTNGMVYGARLFDATRNFVIRDAEFSTNLEEHFKGYTLADMALTFESAYGRFGVSLENVLDKQYVGYYSQSSAALDAAGTYAGRGRTLALSWNRTW